MLTTAYIALSILGVGYVMFALLLGHGDFGHDAGHDGGHVPMLSPTALATLFGCIGAYGLIARYGLDLAEKQSLLVAVPAALVTAFAIATLGFRLMRSSVGSTAIRQDDFAGSTGEVVTPIPAGGLGEVTAQVAGQRYTSSARSEDGSALARGMMVTVVRMVGGTLVVAPTNKTP